MRRGVPRCLPAFQAGEPSLLGRLGAREARHKAKGRASRLVTVPGVQCVQCVSFPLSLGSGKGTARNWSALLPVPACLPVLTEKFTQSQSLSVLVCLLVCLLPPREERRRVGVRVWREREGRKKKKQERAQGEKKQKE